MLNETALNKWTLLLMLLFGLDQIEVEVEGRQALGDNVTMKNQPQPNSQDFGGENNQLMMPVVA